MKRENTTHVLLLVISVLTLIMVGLQFFGIKNYVDQAIEKNEAMKVGGEENYEKLMQLYSSDWFKSAQKQQIESALSQGQGQWGAGADTQANAGAQQEEFPSGKLSDDQLTKIKEGAYVMGDKDAKISIVEYSDPECPFCIRHYNDKTIENLMSKYDGDVNHIVKVVQGVNHPGTQYKSLALLCAGKLGGEKAYYDLYDKILGNSTPENPTTTAQVAQYATDIGLNGNQFTSCVDSKELLSVYSANWQEALSFQSSGTPGNMIINNESGEYKLVAGAYPVETFTSIIDAWMK